MIKRNLVVTGLAFSAATLIALALGSGVQAESVSENLKVKVDVLGQITLAVTGETNAGYTNGANGNPDVIDIGDLIATSTTYAISSEVTATVTTNNYGGYNLSIKDQDNTLTLAHPTDTGAYFAAHTGTYDSPSVLNTGTWGYRVIGDTDRFGSDTTSGSETYAGITYADVTINSNSNYNASPQATTLKFGAMYGTTTVTAGEYSDVITLTATTRQ
jgi:hypothetical protein